MPKERKRIDWNAIRAEYIAGGISQRKLAEKHGISQGYLMQRANAENWTEARADALSKTIEKTKQKTAEAVSNSAITAQRIRDKLLKKLEKEIDSLPDGIGSNFHNGVTTLEYGKDGKSRKPTKTKDSYRDYRLKDLTAAWKDLTEGLPLDDSDKGTVTVIIDV